QSSTRRTGRSQNISSPDYFLGSGIIAFRFRTLGSLAMFSPSSGSRIGRLAFCPQSYGDEPRAALNCRHSWIRLPLGGSLISLASTVRAAQLARGRSTRCERPDVCKREKIYTRRRPARIPLSLRVLAHALAVQNLAWHRGRTHLGNHCWGA